ncbi:Rap1a/Tai family immunity protein [Reyranella sp. CPCC 100927]|uniref:Rap1a/Tai family immunity protein n=1 Tax=Reyranella sp. CPCC 100927 TaxID=2599616 RepID=UPI002106E7CE|nr:Rap1a/Tai family immunity protein [Reyranella sp. CPCC 100927]
MLLGLVALSLPVAAQQNPYTGNEVLPGCRTILNDRATLDFKAGLCAGMVQSLLVAGSIIKPEFEICPPKLITLEQAIRVVVASADKNSQDTHKGFHVLVMIALLNAWPCK